MPYPCLKISFGVGQVLEHIRALRTTSCCDLPFAHSWAACAFFFFQIVVERDGGSIFPFCFSYFIATKDLPSITMTFLRFARPLYKLGVSPHPPRGDWQAELVSFFLNCGCKLRRGASFLLSIATEDFACISYIFLVRPYFPPRLPLLSFA